MEPILTSVTTNIKSEKKKILNYESIIMKSQFLQFSAKPNSLTMSTEIHGCWIINDHDDRFLCLKLFKLHIQPFKSHLQPIILIYSYLFSFIAIYSHLQALNSHLQPFNLHFLPFKSYLQPLQFVRHQHFYFDNSMG